MPILKRAGQVVGVVFEVVGFGGVPDDLDKWGSWFKVAEPFLDTWWARLSFITVGLVLFFAPQIWRRLTVKTPSLSAVPENDRGSQGRITVINRGGDAEVSAHVRARSTWDRFPDYSTAFKGRWESTQAQTVTIRGGSFETLVIAEVRYESDDGLMLSLNLLKSTADGPAAATGNAWIRTSARVASYGCLIELHSVPGMRKPYVVDCTVKGTALATVDLSDWRPRGAHRRTIYDYFNKCDAWLARQ